MIVLIVALTVGWVLMTGSELLQGKASALYVTLLAVGITFLVLVLVGTVMYLVLTIKAINLTRRQSNFVDSVTHELKSPIASLKLYLQTLKRRQLEEEERQGFYGSMLEDIERLDELINHLLDAARLERDSLGHEMEIVDVPELLHDCASAVCLRYRVDPQSITIQAEPSFVRARAVDLDMVFRNLLDNAIKYSGKPPDVTVTVRRVPERVLVRIRDNGSGIPKELRRKIFGRFVRLGSELERQQPGTGLGLYIVRTLVKRLKGKIHVEDATEPEGTVFEVSLPAVYDQVPRESTVAQRQLEGASAERLFRPSAS
jgi:two-component system phosphate regulon sensor histidine kinase PhoR